MGDTDHAKQGEAGHRHEGPGGEPPATPADAAPLAVSLAVVLGTLGMGGLSQHIYSS